MIYVKFAQMIDLSNLQIFARVVEDGSFSSAARFLGTTPSSISRKISQLEGELGARLFHRTTRKQSLTEAGEIYLQHAQRIVTDLEDARLAVSRLAETPSGSLHVTAEADFAVAFIAQFVPEFSDLYPDVQIRLVLSPHHLDLVDSGIDLAIRIGQLDDSSLIARKISESREQICASPSYLAQHGTPEHPSELESHHCLSFQIGPGKHFWRFKLAEGSLDFPISGPVNANSLAFLRDSALAGLGIIAMPIWMIRDELEQGLLVPILKEFTRDPASMPVQAVFAHNRHLAPKVRAFVDFLVERMKGI
jgi:DNA-binding transcriptional LysR family regulator